MIALAAHSHAIPAFPGRGHARSSSSSSFPPATAAPMDVEKGMRGPLPPPCDGEPTLLIVVRDPKLALALGEKAAGEGIKVGRQALIGTGLGGSEEGRWWEKEEGQERALTDDDGWHPLDRSIDTTTALGAAGPQPGRGAGRRAGLWRRPLLPRRADGGGTYRQTDGRTDGWTERRYPPIH